MSARKVTLRKNGRGLWAIDDQAREALASIKDGRDVIVSVKTGRNPHFHRLFFAILGKVVDSGAWPYSVETLLDWVKWRVGHVEVYEVDGRRHMRTKSIAFENMDEAEFRPFVERAVYYLCKDICGEGLRDEIAEMLDGAMMGHLHEGRAA